jgi:hypothetical protein
MSILKFNLHEQHLQTITKTLSRGLLASKLDMDAIKRFCGSRMDCRAMNKVEEGKKVCHDIVESSRAQDP